MVDLGVGQQDAGDRRRANPVARRIRDRLELLARVRRGVYEEPGTLAAADRDPAVFPEPDSFNIDRPNLRKHLGFAYGPHSCLGLHLARLEARIGLVTLLSRLPDLRPTPDEPLIVEGYEFRQPRQLRVCWSS